MEGSDLVIGGSGNDVLYGGPAGDFLDGATLRGNDAALDENRDRISCGGGRDSVEANTFDIVASDCERVRRIK